MAHTSVDRAARRRDDPEWLADAWRRARVLVVDVPGGGRALVRDGQPEPVPPDQGAVAEVEQLTPAADRVELVLFDLGDLAPLDAGRLGAFEAVSPDPGGLPPVDLAARLFLGVVGPDEVPVFAIDAPLPTVPGAKPAALREVAHRLDEQDAGLFTTAVALANWHARHGYSSVDGQLTSADDGGWSRVDEAGNKIWPRTDPAVIVLVHDGVPGPGGRCLLGNNAAWPDDGIVRRFSCLAGYVEPGESAEAAVLREVTEEVGVTPSDVRYLASQSWPFPGSLMLGFAAVADARTPLRLDPVEIAEARWFDRTEVSAALAGRAGLVGDRRLSLPPPSSIARWLIRRWLAD